MGRLLAVVLVGVIVYQPAVQAQTVTCTPTYIWGSTGWSDTLWTPPDADASITANTNSWHVFSPAVPAGEVWKMRTISVSIQWRSGEYMIEHLVNTPPFATAGHYHQIARATNNSVIGTPVLHVPPADAAALVMQAGERLAARANGSSPSMMLLWSGWSFPAACLPRLLGVEASASSGGTATLPNFGPLVTAAQTAAAALTSLSQSVP